MPGELHTGLAEQHEMSMRSKLSMPAAQTDHTVWEVEENVGHL
jgi:hypothetical protein